MKTLSAKVVLATVALALGDAPTVQAQGTVTFNYPWANVGIGYYTIYYDYSLGGMSFRVGEPAHPHNNMMQIGATGPAEYPHNGTPYMAFVNTLGTPQYVVFAWTNGAAIWPELFTNGAPFGLVSVNLADPVAPSLAPVSITFNGFKMDGSMVSQTFTVGGGGSSTFQTFAFNADFALGLTRVEIPSPAWAMDNIVWIPEPGTASLFLVGVLVIMARRAMR